MCAGIPIEDTYFMVFNLFYDASSQETVEPDPLVVAGLVSTQEGWYEFERGWNRVLGTFGVSHLHMNKFAHSKGEFSDWKGNEEKRIQFLSSLIEVMERAVMYGLAIRIIPRDYNAVNKDYHLYGLGWDGAYSLATIICATEAEFWVWDKYPKAALGHVIENGDAGQGALNKLIDKMERSHITILSKYNKVTQRFVRPFEACDFLAYECRLAAKRGPNSRPRRSFLELTNRLPIKAYRFERSGLINWCQARPEDYPRREES